MTLEELFNNLGAALYDGVDPNMEVRVDEEFKHGSLINSIWIGTDGSRVIMCVSTLRAPRRGQRVIWEKVKADATHAVELGKHMGII